MNYRKSFWIMQGASWLFLALLIVDIFAKLRWLTVIGLVLLILGCVQAAKFCRCPYCGKLIDTRRFTLPKACRHCGKILG